ncbi:MAG TPA: amidohydrolase family protein, partial [Candidatus Aphodomonas merdavium]|nr:amidohydrolase family protein [Candidatus Aphodomonas merdavium]
MLFEDVSAFTPQGLLEHCYVGTRGERIAYVGAQRPQEDYGERINGARRLLLPAFYNCHSHTAMTLMRGYGENMKLQDWLNTRIFPFEGKMGAEAIYWGVCLGVAEMFRFGIVG